MSFRGIGGWLVALLVFVVTGLAAQAAPARIELEQEVFHLDLLGCGTPVPSGGRA